MTQIEEICSRAIYLDHGRIVIDGNPAEVIEQYQRSALTAVEEPILVEAPSVHG